MTLKEYIADTDRNKFWRLSGGDAQNFLEEAIDEIGVLKTCRDHWKTSYGNIEKIIQAKKNCERCGGKGYTVFYDHQTHPVPHHDEHKFLCTCLSEAMMEFLKA